jgi:ketosteroid isomerase-like protein
MITEDDIEHLRDGYRLINAREVRTGLLAEDFVLEQTPGIPGTRGTFRGPEGMAASMNELLSGFDEVRFDPHRYDIHGDWVIVPVAFWASARGFEQAVELIHIWKFRDAKVIRLRVLAGDADPMREIEKLDSGE